MQIIHKARHTTISEELKDYAERKIGQKCAHYLDENDDSIRCEIEYDDQFGAKGGLDKRIDVTISLPHQHLPLHIEESDSRFEEAIDKVADRLDQPLAKYKETMR
jgi:ribosomal subunit interface protein